MEQIISNLLVSDSEVIKKATNDLQEAYKRPETIPIMCDLVVSSQQPTIRQFTAVLLKKRFGKFRNWQMIPKDQQEIIRQGMLNALINEQEKTVRNAIAHVIGVLMRHKSDHQDSWNKEVIQFVYQCCSSADPNQSTLGSSIFAILVDMAPDQFKPHINSICQMFTTAMTITETNGNMPSSVVCDILIGMGILVQFVLGNNEAEHAYQKVLPLIIKALQGFAAHDPEKFIKAFDVIENLAEFAPRLLTNVKSLLEFCLETAMNSNLDNSVRIKVVTFVGILAKIKKKTIIKQKLIEPIIQVLFTLMTIPPESEEDDECFVGEECSNPVTAASQTMDLLALFIPPEKFLPPLLQILDPALKGNEPLPKRAAYLSMAMIAEGCSETICAKYLQPLIDTVKVGITDSNLLVRNAAFFALGQFSEHFQPEITKYAADVLPILFEFLQHLCNELKSGGTEPKHYDRMFYALETFCENLEEEALLPYLPTLMDKLFQALDSKNSPQLREFALSSISSTANAAKTNMLPYFPALIEILKLYLVKTADENISALRPQAIDTLAALARTIGKENFMPLTSDTMNFCLALLEDADDPDLRRSLYNLLAALAEVLNEQMAPAYQKIMERIFESILSTEEVVPEFKEDAVIDLGEEDTSDDVNKEIDIEHSEGEDDDDFDIAGYSVENSYLDEKEEAILALKEFAEHTGPAFIPYLQTAYENVFKMIDHPQEDIRKVSIDTLTAFVIALNKQNDQQGALNAVSILIPKLGQLIKEDEECSVVIAALDSIAELLKQLKEIAVPSSEIRDGIFSCVNDVLCGKVPCQFNEINGITGDGDGDEQEDESEYDEAVIESAGNILPLLGTALKPEEFTVLFDQIFPILIQKIDKSRNNEDLDSQRSFAYGVLSECYKPLKNYCEKYFDTLLPVHLAGVKDKNEQVRQNSIFGIGELVLHAGGKSYGAYPQILSVLSDAVSNEKHQSTLDNISGAIARLIINNCDLVPLDQVLPVFIQNLPLKEDFDENDAVFKSFNILYMRGRQEIINHMEQIISLGLHVLYRKEYKDKNTYDNIISFLKDVRQKFPDKFANFVNSNAEVANFVQTL